MTIRNFRFICFAIIGAHLVHFNSGQRIKIEMECMMVVPELIPGAPESILNVLYPDNVKVEPSCTLHPTQVNRVPQVFWKHKPNTYYTLTMLGLDSPDRIKHTDREWIHWLMVNLPNNDLLEGETIVDYVGPGPGEDTGYHRYVFLLYEQPNKISWNENYINNTCAEGRAKFKITKFALKYKLRKLLSGNFFFAEYDDIVPYVCNQLNVPLNSSI